MGRGVDRLGGLGLLGDDVRSQAVVAGPGEDADEAPALRRRERPGLLDEDRVAGVGVVRLVVGLELGREADDPLVEPVAGEPLDGHDDRLVHPVADDATDLRLALGMHLGGCFCHGVPMPTSGRPARTG